MYNVKKKKGKKELLQEIGHFTIIGAEGPENKKASCLALINQNGNKTV